MYKLCRQYHSIWESSARARKTSNNKCDVSDGFMIRAYVSLEWPIHTKLRGKVFVTEYTSQSNKKMAR